MTSPDLLGYDQHTSPHLHKSFRVLHKTSSVNDKTSPALEYWENELTAKDEATKDIQLRNFDTFLELQKRLQTNY